MKFTAAIAAAILGATSALAAPTPNPGPPAQVSTPSVLFPSATSLYNVWTGAVTFGSPVGLIQKTGTTPDITTLVTFDFPSSLAGKTCEFAFILDSTATSTGSQRADVFDSLAPADHSTTTWPNGNLRDNHLGRIFAPAPGTATLEQAYNGAPKFPCPAGQTLGAELVGVYDVDKISWNVLLAGPQVLVH